MTIQRSWGQVMVRGARVEASIGTARYHGVAGDEAAARVLAALLVKRGPVVAENLLIKETR